MLFGLGGVLNGSNRFFRSTMSFVGSVKSNHCCYFGPVGGVSGFLPSCQKCLLQILFVVFFILSTFIKSGALP